MANYDVAWDMSRDLLQSTTTPPSKSFMPQVCNFGSVLLTSLPFLRGRDATFADVQKWAQFSCLWSIINNHDINTQEGKRIIDNTDCCLENLQTHAKSSKFSCNTMISGCYLDVLNDCCLLQALGGWPFLSRYLLAVY